MTTPQRRHTARRIRFALVLIVVALIAASCAPGPEDATSPTDATIRVESLGELDRICIDGVDTRADLSDLELLVKAEGVDEPVSLMIYQAEDVLYATLPLHPATPGQGGTVEVELVDGETSIDTASLELTALPDAPGAWQDAIETMRNQLAVRAEALGTTLDGLRATSVEAASAELLPLKTIQALIDEELEQYPDSADAGLNDDGRALAEAIIAKIGLAQLTPGVADVAQPASCVGSRTADAFGDTHHNLSTRGTENGHVSDPTIRGVSEARGLAVGSHAVRATAAQGESCRVFELEISNGDQLAIAVEKGVDAQVREGGAEERVLQDIQSVAGTLENAPGIYGELISLIGFMFTTMTLWFEMDAAVYPTAFESMNAYVTATEFNEDFEEPGTLTKAEVVATATGFDPAETFSKLAAEMAETIVGAAVGRIAGSLPDGDSGPEQAFALFLGSKARKMIFEGFMARYGQGLWNYCPRSWTVDITHPDYIDFSRVLNGFIEVDKTALTYKPIDVGANSLRVRARSDVFKGLTAQVDVPVETKRIRVVGSPDLILVDTPGETVNIDGRIENADNPTLFWNTPHGSWTDGIGADTNEGRTRPFKTPTDGDVYPFNIEIRSTSQTGLREGVSESDPRTTVIRVELRDLIVTPNPGSVIVEEDLEFLATDSDGEPQSVSWSATGGSIVSLDSDGIVTGAGLYTAFDEPGTYTVTATKTDGSGISTTVEVEVIEACDPIGTWRLREQEFLDQIAELTAEANVTLTHTGGAYYVVFEGDEDGGTFIADRDAWAFIMQVPQGALLAEISGTETGTWSFDGAYMHVNTSGGDVSVSLGIEINGEFRTLPGSGSADTTTGPSFSSAVVECSGTVMTTTVTEGGASITTTLDKIS